MKIQAQIQAQQQAQKQTQKKTTSAQKVGRQADLVEDVSNGRLALWESSVEIWSASPIWGTGYNSFLPFVKEHVPQSYVINNSQGEYVSLHNEYINILVYQGVLGFGLFAAFGILTPGQMVQESAPGETRGPGLHLCADRVRTGGAGYHGLSYGRTVYQFSGILYLMDFPGISDAIFFKKGKRQRQKNEKNTGGLYHGRAQRGESIISSEFLRKRKQ